MKKIYNISREVTSLAERIEYEFTAYNPGTSRTPVPITKIKDKCIGLHELLADLIGLIDKRVSNGIL